MIGDARAYVPLRNLADPAPRSAKEVLRVGETRRFVVVTIDPPLRGIDLAVPGIVDVAAARPPDLDDLDLDLDLGAEPPEEPAEPVRKSRARKAAPKAEVAPAEPVRKSRARKAAAGADAAPAEPVRKSRARKAAAPAADPEVGPAPAEPVRKSRARKAPAEPTADAAPSAAEPQPAAPARRSRSRKAAAAPAATEPAAAAGPPPDNGPAPVKKPAKRTARTKAAVEP
jgi:hypothetical protein